MCSRRSDTHAASNCCIMPRSCVHEDRTMLIVIAGSSSIVRSLTSWTRGDGSTSTCIPVLDEGVHYNQTIGSMVGSADERLNLS